jgi:hypothetical protein
MGFMLKHCCAAAAFAVLVVNTSLAVAGPCEVDIAKIDRALSNQDIPADTRAQAEDMRKQAADLCAAGNTEEGIAVAAEVKALLQIE